MKHDVRIFKANPAVQCSCGWKSKVKITLHGKRLVTRADLLRIRRAVKRHMNERLP